MLSDNASSLQGWRYYNHAIVPSVAPHVTPDLTIFKSAEIWKNTNWGANSNISKIYGEF